MRESPSEVKSNVTCQCPLILPIQQDIVDQYSTGDDGSVAPAEISELEVNEHSYGDDGLVAGDDGALAIDEIDAVNIESTNNDGNWGNDQGSDDSADWSDSVQFDDNWSLDDLE